MTPDEAAAALAAYRLALEAVGIVGELAEVIVADYARTIPPAPPTPTGETRRARITNRA